MADTRTAAEGSQRSWLEGLWSDLGQFADRALDRHLRLAVTGLRRSGKTVFTTALVHHLLDGRGLPFLAAVHEGRFLGARLVPLGYGEEFPFARYHAALSADPPSWPKPTERLSRLLLAVRFYTTNPLLRAIQPIQELLLEIVDYPGEWLLDLPILGGSFESFAEEALALAARAPRAALARPWLELARGLDQAGPPEAAAIDRLAAAYCAYLRACQEELGLAYVVPGRFVHPGELEGHPALRFAPLPPAPTRPGSLRAAVIEAFERYREEVVRPFYEDHFRGFDRQIVLVDLLTALNQGPAHFADTQRALERLAASFRYGRSGLLARLFAPRIDRVLFAASKADHVAPSQHAALKQLLEILVAPAGRAARFEGLVPEFLAISALRSTDVVRTEHDGQILSCVRGRLAEDGRETVLFPGEIPPELPEPEDWTSGRFRFRAFAPRRLQPGVPGQHIRLDQALEFLIGDKLR
ncbi:MAG: YcjX family protein [Geminicoccaceae bacterium]|nr:YcjX family protein [Geminicoccaceae bacterium]MDW8368903.1 YcjX family protein [Geminicoccaceae bacterium]